MESVPDMSKPAKGMNVHKGAGTFSIDVEIAYVKFPFGFIDPQAIIGVHRSGQTIFGSVGKVDGLVISLYFEQGENRSRKFLPGRYDCRA